MQKVVYGFLTVLVLVACNKKEEKGQEASVAAPLSAIETATASGAASAPETYTTAPAQQVQATGVRLNPPHGEPGHICEIAVGAPLPTEEGILPAPVEIAPERPTPISPGATSVLNMPLNTMVNSGPKPRFNPPHGQPWHTCDLEVGAPLP